MSDVRSTDWRVGIPHAAPRGMAITLDGCRAWVMDSGEVTALYKCVAAQRVKPGRARQSIEMCEKCPHRRFEIRPRASQ